MYNKCPYVYMRQNEIVEKVDIIMLAYNHAEFIEDAIESVLMQQTKYAYKIKIGEDCSTDSTRQIIMNYYEQYPDKIELYLWKENVGANKNSVELLKSCKGKYIACLEGDDYWTDSYKLEKQISFLEKHKEYIGTAHNVCCVDKEGKLLHQDFSLYPIYEEHIFGQRQAERFELAGHTASLLFRNVWSSWSQEKMEAFFLCDGNGDVKINTLLGLLGEMYCFRDIMAAHRRIFQGTSWTARSYNKNMLWFRYSLCSALQKYLKEYENISLSMDGVFQALYEESIIKLLCNCNIDNLNVFWKFLKRKIVGE